MKFIEDDGRAAREGGIVEQSASENSFGDDLQAGFGSDSAFESDLVADFCAQSPALLMSDPFGSRSGRGASWLKHDKVLAGRNDTWICEQSGWNAAGFTSAGFGHDHDTLMKDQGVLNQAQIIVDRQRSPIRSKI